MLLFSCSQQIVPLAVLRKRELKWLDMLENWEKWMSKRFKKVFNYFYVSLYPGDQNKCTQYVCHPVIRTATHPTLCKGKFNKTVFLCDRKRRTARSSVGRGVVPISWGYPILARMGGTPILARRRP